MEVNDEEIFSAKQAVLFALLEKTSQRVRLFSDDEADELLRALHQANQAVLKRQQAFRKTPTKKLVQMGMGDLLKLVESEHLSVNSNTRREKREERGPSREPQGKPPKKVREMHQAHSARLWDAEQVSERDYKTFLLFFF